MNSKERLKRQGGDMSGRRPLTFDEAITFPLVVLAVGGSISSLMEGPERCGRCGHGRAAKCPTGVALIHRTRSKHALEEIAFARKHGTSPVHHAYVPPKGES